MANKNLASTIDDWIDNKVLQNILIWIFVYLIGLLSIQADNVFLTALRFVAFLALPVYINNLKILPFFLTNKIALGIFFFFLNVSVFTLVGVFFAANFFIDFQWRLVYNLFGILMLILVFSSSIKLARDSFMRKQQEKEAQLQLLKAQLNPHFLFNTLNNLYGLSVLKSDALPNLMLKLSDLLRYSLYDTKAQFVPLVKEIQYLENYISLEKIRLEDKTEISFQKEGISQGKIIAPMLLIIFVENAFKHLGKSQEGTEFVKISLQITQMGLIFRCENTVDTTAGEPPNMEQEKSGIGLQNAKKRVALLYSEKHALQINKTEVAYTVALSLQF